ncbi:hypothetical protein PUN28_018555 [Cardiocondyla obscurior]|uniref:50S ribosomal protein L20 n=1 Tax=Cardiocondyla obscurior TaxID=286306 RepID=A0AAW2EGG6_9HYME
MASRVGRDTRRTELGYMRYRSRIKKKNINVTVRDFTKRKTRHGFLDAFNARANYKQAQFI